MALLPHSIIQDEVTTFKQEALEKFGSGHALRSPPHITLLPPFRSNQTDFSALQAFASTQQLIEVALSNFDRFGTRVIFVNVLAEQSLTDCQQRLSTFCAEQFAIPSDPRPFHPHMTVAFKDLKKAVFPQAWAYFSEKTYERLFTATAITLLIHTGQRWEIQEEFPFDHPKPLV
ncbi:2'-5' RNA ligase family protein [Spirosoma soli]|uniref:2'-5' RNA ligase family protein n=1 Tax=Spirosoma soli TaxID=1770529 RepID=A0ABW5MA55_9BACT